MVGFSEGITGFEKSGSRRSDCFQFAAEKQDSGKKEFTTTSSGQKLISGFPLETWGWAYKNQCFPAVFGDFVGTDRHLLMAIL